MLQNWFDNTAPTPGLDMLVCITDHTKPDTGNGLYSLRMETVAESRKPGI